MKEISPSKLKVKSPLNNSWSIGKSKLQNDINRKMQLDSIQANNELLQAYLDQIKETKNATTSLEFLICTLSNKLGLKPIQVFQIVKYENRL